MNSNDKADQMFVILKILLQDQNGDYLILKKVKQELFAGAADLPGGRVDKDEVNMEFHDLIDREIKEEIGNVEYELRKDPVSTAIVEFPEDKINATYILFEAKLLKGEIKLSEEHSEFSWIKLTKENYQAAMKGPLEKLIKNYFDWNK